MQIPDEAKDVVLRSLAVWLIGNSPLASQEEREAADDLVAGAKAALIRETIVALGTINDRIGVNMRKQQAVSDEATLLANPDLAELDVRMRGFYE